MEYGNAATYPLKPRRYSTAACLYVSLYNHDMYHLQVHCTTILCMSLCTVCVLFNVLSTGFILCLVCVEVQLRVEFVHIMLV